MNALSTGPGLPTTAQYRRLGQGLFCLCFLIVLVAPLTGLWDQSTDQRIREREKREAAKFPQFTVTYRAGIPFPKKRSLREFPRTFERWFNDHLGFRQAKLKLYHLAQQAGVFSQNLAHLAVGQSDRAPVIIGREGWLFYSGDRLVEDYRCTALFQQSELAHWRKILSERQQWLADRGIHYVVVFAPNKHSIYAEYLPRAMNRVGRKSRLDQLVEFMQDSAVPIVDLRKNLIAGKTTARTYHRTDTHWNQFGAFLGYRGIIQELQSFWPKLQPWSLSDFDMRTVDAPGDYLAKLVESPVPYREEVIELLPRRPRQAVSQELLVPESDQARYHLSENPTADLPNIVVLHDSFMMALAPYLNEHFQRIQYESTNEFPTELIERERPVLVIQELVQRRLMDHRPRNPQGMFPRTEQAGPPRK